MQLSDIMTSNPLVLRPDTMLREAAQKMRDLGSGVMPVGENDRLVGMLTDRDITVRATADGMTPTPRPCAT
jgi:CBS domain-containing protein